MTTYTQGTLLVWLGVTLMIFGAVLYAVRHL